MKMKDVPHFAQTTRVITGKTTVSCFSIQDMDLEVGIGTYIHNGMKYEAVRGPKTRDRNRKWYLNGNYEM